MCSTVGARPQQRWHVKSRRPARVRNPATSCTSTGFVSQKKTCRSKLRDLRLDGERTQITCSKHLKHVTYLFVVGARQVLTPDFQRCTAVDSGHDTRYDE